MQIDTNVVNIPVVVLAVLFAIVLVPLYLASILWAFGNARARGKSGCLVAILVAFLSWPLGLVAWVVFRPDELTENRRVAHPMSMRDASSS